MKTIDVISPDGKFGSIPESQWAEAQKQGFIMPGAPDPNFGQGKPAFAASDISPDGKSVNVVSPDGKVGVIPVEQLEPALAQNYKLASQDRPQADLARELRLEQDKKDLESADTDNTLSKLNKVTGALLAPGPAMVSTILEAVKTKIAPTELGTGDNAKSLVERHKDDQITDAKGNFLLKSADGQVVAMPANQLQQALNAGYKFQDENFQTLFDARMAHGKESRLQGNLSAASAGLNNIFGLGDWSRQARINNPNQDPTNKSQDLAEQMLEGSEYGKARIAGSVIGTGQELLVPIPGAASAKAAVAAKMGEGLLAKAIGGAVEGAIISAPHALAEGVIKENVQGAAESLAMGAGIGGILGLGAGLINKGAQLFEGTRGSKIDAVAESLGASKESVKAIEPHREPFMKALESAGVTHKSSPEQVLNSLKSLESGEHLSSTLAKLDKAAELSSASPIRNAISNGIVESGEKAALESLASKLDKLAPNGNISLSNWQKFNADLAKSISGKADDALNAAKQEILSWSRAELLKAGEAAVTQAESKVGAKLATEWAEGKAIAEISGQMRQQFLKDIGAGKLDPSLSPVGKLILNGIVGKAAPAVGSMVGGLPGYAVGEGFKKALSSFGERYLQGSGNKWLSGNRTSQAIGSYMALDAVHAVNARVQQIAPFISNLSAKVPAAYVASANPIKSILGSEANGLSKEQQYHRLSEEVALLAGNPDLLARRAEQAAADFADHPQLAAQIKQDYARKVEVLNGILNKAPPSNPFQKAKRAMPSRTEMADIEAQLKVAENPFALLDGLKNGKVSAKQVEVAATLTPGILNQIRQEINKEAYTGKVNLTYQQRLAVSTIMGQPMDPSLKAVPQLQAAYGQPAPQGQPAPGKPAKLGSQGASKASLKLPGAQGTLSQRISGK